MAGVRQRVSRWGLVRSLRQDRAAAARVVEAMASLKIMRAVTKVTPHYNAGYGKHRAVGGSNRMDLECGHDASAKFSSGVPTRMRCRSCESLSAGGQSKRDKGDGTMIVEGWDAETQMPTFTVAPSDFRRR